ncbi:hypothetical protein E2C01_100003 [Portunus trituberculatus]|uniref:Uncharacterized protein n=1 Tax=Portunus trituberculatus TaxID=210409 RepID=A0A5B7K6W7_PORTR|nr:hypothetical protein [Portunus trituberculatus]
MVSTASHSKKVDNIQCRVPRLVEAADRPAQPESVSPLHSLEHSRDGAAIVVFLKTHMLEVSHLAGLRQPPRVAARCMRTMHSEGCESDGPYRPSS